jgi:hypothetical protein
MLYTCSVTINGLILPIKISKYQVAVIYAQPMAFSATLFHTIVGSHLTFTWREAKSHRHQVPSSGLSH